MSLNHRSKIDTYDAVVVGAGPNGLAAAITLAQAGRSVLVIEAKETIGGGARTLEITLPGYRHDICSAVHALGLASPFFRKLQLAEYGVEWVHPSAPLAHPLDDGTAVILERDVQLTAERLGPDASAYRHLMVPLVKNWEKILDDILGPFPIPPKHPFIDLDFGLHALRPAVSLAKSTFISQRARAIFAGLSAHSILPLERPVSAGFGLMLGMLGHAVGWPVARGGSQNFADALANILRSAGGEIVTGQPVCSIDELPPARAVLFDVTPRQFLSIAGSRLPDSYRRQLERFRYGPGVFKLDYALDGPIPWKAPEAMRAGTVHVGGTLEEVATSEREVWQGKHPEKPFVLVVQQSLFDPTRAPDGKQTLWAYCHVPNASSFDMTGRIEAQIERFAPGFRDCILERSVRSPADIQAYDANYIGGDINGGVQDLPQFFTRPVIRANPYSTPVKGIYICSSSTPPGGGVHGMCGYYAAKSALKYIG